MYNNQFVVALKSNGKVLREQKETVYLPFGCEYSVFLKNLNTKRAAVRITIDGSDVLNGRQLVLEGNSELNLERFLGDSLNEGRKFKFIERTSDIEQHRGIGAEDGLIRVEFQYEVSRPWISPPVVTTTWPKYTSDRVYFYGMNSNTLGDSGEIKCSGSPTWNAGDGTVRSFVSQSGGLEGSVACNAVMDSMPLNNAGITAEGSKSYQSFNTTSLGIMETEVHAIVLQLKGEVGQMVVTTPVTVKSRKYCPNCGRRYNWNLEYCSHDGTFLKTEQFTTKAA